MKQFLLLLSIYLTFCYLSFAQTAEEYFLRGNAKVEKGDFRAAIEDYTKAIQINPNYAWAYINRGIAKFNLWDKFGACSDWSKAGELGLKDAYDYIRMYCK
ncbi:tetratricopeptide repeat protein [Bacteroidetes/Chlorobi group bacterium Naka2016]|jgi:tetratricopeptide (TPR) repeat protein|nr:MAG: tetratricopeptide repeat protein [Bacteroidetes/Chlorobi group bacterium Naka2016]